MGVFFENRHELNKTPLHSTLDKPIPLTRGALLGRLGAFWAMIQGGLEDSPRGSQPGHWHVFARNAKKEAISEGGPQEKSRNVQQGLDKPLIIC